MSQYTTERGINVMDIDIFRKQYELADNAPPPVDMDEYFRAEKSKYFSLLDSGLIEKEYQKFFELNPAFMPGAYELIGGTTSHIPVMNALISQPTLGEEKIRKPDFMWLAKDSICFCPVFIEIERPSKQEFRQDEAARAVFTQAAGQIKQWKAILNSIDGRKSFYDRYSIPQELRDLKFTPQYLLVFGRRAEYEGNTWLTSLRAEEQSDDFRVMSFDRLANPDRNVYDMVTCKVVNGNYEVICIPPTYVYRPCIASLLKKYSGFYEAIDRMRYVSSERKTFLKMRYQYWETYGSKNNIGLSNSSDKE